MSPDPWAKCISMPCPQPRPKMVRWPSQELVRGPKQVLLPTLISYHVGTWQPAPPPHGDRDTHRHVGRVDLDFKCPSKAK